ncbi:MAG: pentapeptide repeat-containing protein [Ruminococcus sp.]|nr:pentapeptide repeat-containing protein [Ruminococcus sp.]
MSVKRITPPEIPEELFDISDDESFFLELFSREPFDASCIGHINASGKQLDGFSAWGCVIKNCRFNNTKAYKVEFYDTEFKNCDFSGCDMTEGIFKRCRFVNCKGVGVNFSRGSFMDVTFERCVMEYVNFSATRFDFTEFNESNIKFGEMASCVLRNTVFSESNLARVNFAKTPLKGIDLTSCEIDGIMVSEGFSELKGAIVTSYQASELAVLLGLDIR